MADALNAIEAELAQARPGGRRLIRNLRAVTEILTEVAVSATAAGEAERAVIKLAPQAIRVWILAEHFLK